jgi:hypothetical protein
MKKILILLSIIILIFMAFAMPAIAQEGSIIAPGLSVAPDQGSVLSLPLPAKTEVTAPELQKVIQSLSVTLWIYAMVMVVISSIEVLISIILLSSHIYCRRQVLKIPIHDPVQKKEATT